MSRETGNASKIRVQFASDNYSGICPEAWSMMQEANAGHVLSYGDDEWTERACNLLREIFETDCEVFFALTGTAANALALASLCQSYHSVLCHRAAHVETDECGAPEQMAGCKLIPLPSSDGKLHVAELEKAFIRRGDQHYSQTQVLSIT
ncbi:MAG TPA: beta-eliminating lyase-related protein, partial [Armatimonadota bacterium]|nr:beta-eliminating lyase-related protein [Armatimonadota bacterium]